MGHSGTKEGKKEGRKDKRREERKGGKGGMTGSCSEKIDILCYEGSSQSGKCSVYDHQGARGDTRFLPISDFLKLLI